MGIRVLCLRPCGAGLPQQPREVSNAGNAQFSAPVATQREDASGGSVSPYPALARPGDVLVLYSWRQQSARDRRWDGVPAVVAQQPAALSSPPEPRTCPDLGGALRARLAGEVRQLQRGVHTGSTNSRPARQRRAGPSSGFGPRRSWTRVLGARTALDALSSGPGAARGAWVVFGFVCFKT